MDKLTKSFAMMGGAISLVQKNLAAIVRHMLPVYAVWTVGIAALKYVENGQFRVAPLGVEQAEGVQTTMMAFASFAIGAVFSLVAYPYLAAAWHRIVLRPDAVRPSKGQVADYLGRLLQQSIIVTPLFIALGFFFVWHSAPPAGGMMDIANYGFGALLGWIFLRIGLVLPAASVGRTDFGISQSWRATKGAGLALVLVAAFEMALWTVCDKIIQGADAVSGLLGVGTEAVLWPLPFLVGLAILTKLYEGGAEDA